MITRLLKNKRMQLALLAGLVVMLAGTVEAAAKKRYLERVVVTPAKAATGSTKKKAVPAQSKAKKAKAAQKAIEKSIAKDGGKKLGREFVFDGSTVNGQYHSAGEAVAKVEQEKKMNDLVGMRRDFKDRLGAEKDRLQRGEEP